VKKPPRGASIDRDGYDIAAAQGGAKNAEKHNDKKRGGKEGWGRSSR
jgi:hypothetical protein